MILLKLLALPFMAVFEILLMALCIVMGLLRIKPALALKVIKWSERLPDLKWYYT